VEEVDPEQLEQLRVWTGKLHDFTTFLPGIDGTGPIDFCEKACEAWQVRFTADPPTPATAATLVVLETLQALMAIMHAASRPG
jgi:hypothetical protein